MCDLKIPFLLMIAACAMTMSACFDDSPAGPPPPPQGWNEKYYSSSGHRGNWEYSSEKYWRSSSSRRSWRSSSSVVTTESSSAIVEILSSSESLVSSSDVLPKSSSSAKADVSSSSVTSKVSSSSEVLEVSSSSIASKISSSSEKSKSSSSSAKIFSSSEALKVFSSSVAVKVSSSNVTQVSSSSNVNENWRETCLDIINAYRATENLAPLSLAPDAKQTCTDNQAADDLAENSAHGHFGACGEGAQNTGPNVRMSATQTYADYAQMYLKMMWEDEKALVTSGAADPSKDEDYPRIGHYLNMKGAYKTVACGFAVTENGKTGWLNINFFR